MLFIGVIFDRVEQEFITIRQTLNLYCVCKLKYIVRMMICYTIYEY